MKRIGLISSSRVFAQSFAEAMEARPELGFTPLLLLNPRQALLDAELMELDLVVLDIAAESVKKSELLLPFCREIRKRLPNCRIVLLAFQDDKEVRELVRNAVKGNDADDFVFYDTSLEYMFAKLASL